MVYTSVAWQMLSSAVTVVENAVWVLSLALLATCAISLWQARRTTTGPAR